MAKNNLCPGPFQAFIWPSFCRICIRCQGKLQQNNDPTSRKTEKHSFTPDLCRQRTSQTLFSPNCPSRGVCGETSRHYFRAVLSYVTGCPRVRSWHVCSRRISTIKTSAGPTHTNAWDTHETMNEFTEDSNMFNIK